MFVQGEGVNSQEWLYTTTVSFILGKKTRRVNLKTVNLYAYTTHLFPGKSQVTTGKFTIHTDFLGFF